MFVTVRYDGENRIYEVTGAGISYEYDGEGRRVRRTAPDGVETVYVYDHAGELAAEYSKGTGAAEVGVRYLTTDQIGNTRMVTDSTGAVVRRMDYTPFGIVLDAGVGVRSQAQGYTNAGDGGDPSQKFAGKERDPNTRLDYFGSRYFSRTQGRFTSPDPVMASAVLPIPQSWNRFAYVLNNPLRFIDPTGEVWIPTGNSSSPYIWSDTCYAQARCYDSVAAASAQGVTVYGSRGSNDVSVFRANDAGVVDINGIAGHGDAQFEVGPQRVREDYLSPQAAAALFNVAADYHSEYGRDGKLVFTGGSARTGRPGVDPVTGVPLHQSHQDGANIDLRYMGSNGQSLARGDASAMADVSGTH